MLDPWPTVQDDYLATLDVLREAADYLARLPPHPMTTAMVRKLNAHLSEPRRTTMARLEEEQAQVRKRDRLLMTGANYTPAGLPVIQANLLERTLTLRQPRQTCLSTRSAGTTS
jgi:hypothetical protein